MAKTQTPVVIAYDGSELSQAGLRHAAELFPGRPAVVATVWESGLATVAPMATPDVMGGAAFPAGPAFPPDPETVEAVDRAQRDHATTVAQQGADLARSLGLVAEAHAVPDEADVADTLIQLARERDAAAIVVGSHGISGLRTRLLGSVARELIQHGGRPVVVVRGE
jgi:nucleotide-binding universal stress UspA family protein